MTKRKTGARRAKRTFSVEFKQEAVRLMQGRRAAGVSLEQIARELDVGPDLLRTWSQPSGGIPSVGGASPAPGAAPESEAEELRRLRREVAVLRQEREFLKKATAFFAKESR